MSDEIKKFTFFYPVFNEEKNIERVINLADTVGKLLMEKEGIEDYEILVVDDCSTDSTPEKLEVLKKNNVHLRTIRHEQNKKLGGALKTGFYNATGDVILYSDADLPFDLHEAIKALRLMKIYDSDIVSAYRFDRTAEGPRRAIYSFVYNLMIRFIFGIRVRDINFSFKLIKRRVFERVKLKSDGSFIDAELIIRASKHGFKIIQFGTDYFARTRGVSTLSGLDVVLKIIKEMVLLYPELKRTGKNNDKPDS